MRNMRTSNKIENCVYDDENHNLATKLDIKKLELRLQAEAQKDKYELIQWQFCIAFILAIILAKGFNWL
jgi:hypothetical protein